MNDAVVNEQCHIWALRHLALVVVVDYLRYQSAEVVAVLALTDAPCVPPSRYVYGAEHVAHLILLGRPNPALLTTLRPAADSAWQEVKIDLILKQQDDLTTPSLRIELFQLLYPDISISAWTADSQHRPHDPEAQGWQMAAGGFSCQPRMTLVGQIVSQIAAGPDGESMSCIALVLAGSLLQILTARSCHLSRSV
jgi:hypothetical protein